MGHPLGSAVSQPCPGRCFCGRIRGAAKATAKASTPFHPHPSIHPSLFAFSWFEGAETAPGPQTNWPPLGRESCWGSAVSEPCPRRCFRSRIHGAAQGRYIKRSTAKASTSTPIHPLFAFSWFEGAETAPGPQSYWPPLGLESCWGSAVSEPCPRRCFCSRTITSRLAKCFASICFAACPTVLRNGPCRSLLYPDSCWTSFPIRLLVFAYCLAYTSLGRKIKQFSTFALSHFGTSEHSPKMIQSIYVLCVTPRTSPPSKDILAILWPQSHGGAWADLELQRPASQLKSKRGRRHGR